MPYILVYAGTILVSRIMDIDLSLQMMKDVADAGYKIDTEKLNDFNKFLNKNITKNRLLYSLIPIVNIAFSFVTRINYENGKDLAINQLISAGIIEEMLPIEKELYNKRPTKFNALKSTIEVELRLKHANILNINNEDEDSKIYYELEDTCIQSLDTEDLKDNITILKVEGDASRLSIDEQKEKVIGSLNVKKIVFEFDGGIEQVEYAEDILENGISREGNEEIYDAISGLSENERETILEALRRLKKQMLEAKQEEITEDKQTVNETKRLGLKRNKQ